MSSLMERSRECLLSLKANFGKVLRCNGERNAQLCLQLLHKVCVNGCQCAKNVLPPPSLGNVENPYKLGVSVRVTTSMFPSVLRSLFENTG